MCLIFILEKARKGTQISGDVGDHPDDKYDLNALPIVKGITIECVGCEGFASLSYTRNEILLLISTFMK